jgi:hypothetical protein
MDVQQRSNRKMGHVVVCTVHQILDYYGCKTNDVICVECVLRTVGEATCVSLWFSISKILLHEGTPKNFSSPEEILLMKTLRTSHITLFLHFDFASSAHTYCIPHDFESNIPNLSRKTEEKMRNSVRTARVPAEYEPP